MIINIKDFDYFLPEERIAKFPTEKRGDSKLLYYNGEPTETHFSQIANYIPKGAMLVFNNTKVIRARLLFFKPTGARIEILCLEPHSPSDYERAFSCKQECRWYCMVGNSRKWKDGTRLSTSFLHHNKEYTITAEKIGVSGKESIIRFEWSDTEISFGELLEALGTVPIPPYLNRQSQECDNTRYQTVYSKKEGSVAAPTAGLHFTEEIIEELQINGFSMEEVTLHVGAGTFLPVKSDNAALHTMHTEHFEIKTTTIAQLILHYKNIIAVGTTSVRTLESLSVLGYRALKNPAECNLHAEIGQWEAYDIPALEGGLNLLKALYNCLQQKGITTLKCSTSIMITPTYTFRVINGMFTNFHQPQSTLLLLISALIGDKWREVYQFAMDNNFRFLSYGDSSLLLAPTTSEKKQ